MHTMAERKIFLMLSSTSLLCHIGLIYMFLDTMTHKSEKFFPHAVTFF